MGSSQDTYDAHLDTYQKTAYISGMDDYKRMYQRPIEDREGFWAEQAQKYLTWEKPWDAVLKADMTGAAFKWFDGGMLNASYNCLDRHLHALKNRVAFYWEGDDPHRNQVITYLDLYHRVDKFYTAPTVIRAMAKEGEEMVQKHDISSLKLLGSVGEPINPEAWRWYYHYVGRDWCPIMDTWWQTETGGHMLTPLPGVGPIKPGSCGFPFFGVDPVILDPNTGVEKSEDFKKELIQLVRAEIGPITTIDQILAQYPAVCEAAVISKNQEGQSPFLKAFISVQKGIPTSNRLKQEIKAFVHAHLSDRVPLKEVEFMVRLPRTAAGKLLRRVLRARELGLPFGDIAHMQPDRNDETEPFDSEQCEA